MMNNLVKYSLDNERTHEFVKDRLQDVNIVSTMVLDHLERFKGEYFTLLPINSNIERLYEFEAGVILPQNPVIDYEVDGRRAKYTETPSIKGELSELICKFLVNNNKYVCLIDDVTRRVNDPNNENLYSSKVVVSVDGEVCYLVSNNESSKGLILDCLRKSESFWHSLGFISLIDKEEFPENTLSLNQLQSICNNIDLVFVSAYDAESYVFWNRLGSNILDITTN